MLGSAAGAPTAVADPIPADTDAPAVESDISTLTQPTTTADTATPSRSVAGGGGGGFDIDSLLDAADANALDELTSRLADGRITVSEPAPEEEIPADEPEGQGPAAPREIEQVSTGTSDPDDGPSRARVRLTTDDDRALVALAKAEGITLLEAADRIRGEKAKAIDDLVEVDDPDPTSPAPKSDATPPPSGLSTVADAEARILELEDQADEAQFAEYDDQKALELRREARNLRRQIPAIADAEAQARESETARLAADYDAQWERAEARAKNIFPELAQPDSPMLAEMQRLDQEAKRSNPGLYHRPDKFLELALTAAETLRAAGKPLASASASAATSNATPSQPRNPAARGVVSGLPARATTPAPATPPLSERLDQVTTADEMAELDALLGIR